MTRPSWWTEADERQVALLHSLGSLGESEADGRAALVIMDMLDDFEGEAAGSVQIQRANERSKPKSQPTRSWERALRRSA